MEIILQAVGGHADLHEVLENYEQFKSQPDASKFAVIKIGGPLLREPRSQQEHLQRELLGIDLAGLAQAGLYPAVVHGAGPQLDKRFIDLGIETPKVKGVRETPKIASAALEHTVRQLSFKLAGLINAKHPHASSYIPPHYGTLEGELIDPTNISSLHSLKVNPEHIRAVANMGKIPLLGCVGRLSKPNQPPAEDPFDQFEPININADTAAAAIAVGLGVQKYISLTETGAVLDADGKPISELSIERAEEMIVSGEIYGGMVPKVQEAVTLITQGIGSVAITSPKNLLVELFTNAGRGTLIK